MEMTERQLAGITDARRVGRRESLIRQARGTWGGSGRWSFLLILGVLLVGGVMEAEGIPHSVGFLLAALVYAYLMMLDRRLQALVALVELEAGESERAVEQRVAPDGRALGQPGAPARG